MTVDDTPEPASLERPTIPILDAPTMLAASRALFAEARGEADRLAALPLQEVTVETILDTWDRTNAMLEDIIGPAAILGSVHPLRSVRDAAEEVLVEATRFGSEVYQNEALYERVRRVEASTPAQRMLRKDLLEGFEDSGVSLPPEQRQRVREIAEELERLNQDFDRQIRDNAEKIRFSPDEVVGAPPELLARAERDGDGNYLLSFDYPDYTPFMANADDAGARRRYYVGYMRRGGEGNVRILDQIVALRRELAGLYGLESYAHYVTRRNMAGSPGKVADFLRDVEAAVREAERLDLERLRAVKARDTGVPEAEARIERWDHAYYSEKLRRQEFSIDQEKLRSYFPTLPAVDWVLAVTSRLYGIQFQQELVPVWHPDVRYFDVFENDGSFIGGIYLDLFPRDGKYKHAAAWPVRGVSRASGRTPISVLVCNFDRRGLTHNEVETLFHEFGHVLHGVLSDTHYNAHSGTSVDRDFVEAPSQMYEEWARRPESLALLSAHAPEAPVLDVKMIEQLAAARRFGRGINYARQHLYASFDMSLASENPPPAMEYWREMEQQTPMGHVDGTEFPGTFGHIAADYAAGYYGYMWSEVLALDMLSAFGDDLMDKSAGYRFRENILARGGEEEAMELVRRFLGREVSSEAFFAEITGKR